MYYLEPIRNSNDASTGQLLFLIIVIDKQTERVLAHEAIIIARVRCCYLIFMLENLSLSRDIFHV